MIFVSDMFAYVVEICCCSCISDLGCISALSQKDKHVQILEEENARLIQTIDDMKNSVMAHSSPDVSPDSNNATRKLRDEINTLTKRNCGKILLHLSHAILSCLSNVDVKYFCSAYRVGVAIKIYGRFTRATDIR